MSNRSHDDRQQIGIAIANELIPLHYCPRAYVEKGIKSLKSRVWIAIHVILE